ncbi:MAG: ATP-binding protein [Spirochaetales bacterium]|nr:ATP-binding protein [Spirochaetales bacterium]
MSTIIPAMSCILYIIFTVFGLYQGRTDKSLKPFNLYMFMMMIWSFGSFMMHGNFNVYTPLIWNRIMMVGMLGVPITMFHALLSLTGNKGRRYTVSLFIGYLVYAVSLYKNFKGDIVDNAWFTGSEFNYLLGQSAILIYSLCYIYMILALIHLSRELYKTENKVLKRKLTYPIYGVVILLISVLANLYEPLGRYPIDILGTTLNAIFIFYAIYNYQLLNYSALVLRMTLYFILIIVSSTLFYGSMLLMRFVDKMSETSSPAAISVLLGIILTLTFQPLRKGTKSFIEKLYLGRRFSTLQDLKNFSDSLKSIVDLTELGARTTEKIMESYKLEWCTMLVHDYSAGNYQIISWRGLGVELGSRLPFSLKENKEMKKVLSGSRGGRIQKVYPSFSLELNGKVLKLKPSLILPLIFKNRINGYIIMGPGKERAYYNQFELNILEILSDHSSVTLENAISFERLKNQQHKLQVLNQELVLSRNKLEAFFDGITAPISIQDINYNIIMVNFAATKYFQKHYDEMINEKCYRIYFNREHPCEKCLAQDCLHTQLPFSVEQTSQEKKLIFDVHFYPISVPSDQKLFLEFFQDITQQKQLQAELIQSEKLAGIGTLASGIAHELNNPLAGILGTAEIMIDSFEPESKLYEYTNDIIQYSETAASVIKDLTNYSRKEKGVAEFLQINDVLHNSIRLAQRGMNFEGIQIHQDLGDLPPVELNNNSLQQVFMNIIVNAVQSMPGGGHLYMESRLTSYSIRISIRDTGIGIDKQDIQQVFDPFFTTKEPGKGTGLGLSITHQILTEMGGRIHINSTYEHGTEIIVSLPLETRDKWKIRFVNVKTPEERDDVFFIQRKILVGEMGYREETIRRDIDEHAFHVLAYKGLQPVGTASCVTSGMTGKLPISNHFDISEITKGKRTAEIDRLAVLKKERGSIIPMGLMTLAYLYARVEDTETLFLDVFADDKKQVAMYGKLGFQYLGEYSDPSLCQVMMLDHRTDYERKSKRMEHFVKPLMSRLEKLMDFDEENKNKFMKAIDILVSTPSDM